MSILYLIRHGQASFGQADYDRLSELGEVQMHSLGKFWVQRGIRPDAVYAGALVRQQNSARWVKEEFSAAGEKFPDPIILNNFDEYETRHLLTGSLSTVLTQYPELAQLVKEPASGVPPDLVNNKKAFQKVFARAMDMWVDEKLKLPGMETWREFTGRVNQGLDLVIAEQGSGKTVAVFTSGGPISAAIQKALGLGDKTALELGWVIANGSITEFRYSEDKFSLASFNTTPHLDRPGLISYR